MSIEIKEDPKMNGFSFRVTDKSSKLEDGSWEYTLGCLHVTSFNEVQPASFKLKLSNKTKAKRLAMEIETAIIHATESILKNQIPNFSKWRYRDTNLTYTVEEIVNDPPAGSNRLSVVYQGENRKRWVATVTKFLKEMELIHE